jgi:hypothetical protein
MNNFSVLLGSLMSILGFGSGLASQGVSIHQQLNQQQAYSQSAVPGQGCWLERGGALTPGTFAVVEHANGTKTLECVPNAGVSQR